MNIHPDYTDIKFVITVHNHSDQDDLYNELETDGIAPPETDILRSVACIDRKPSSRATVYKLSLNEVEQLKKDSRIKNIEPHPEEMDIKVGTCAVTQTSSEWDKSTSSTSTMKNWALLRCTEGVQRSGWGDRGYDYNGTIGTTSQTGTIELTQTGKNVDVVICDTGLPYSGHPEFAVNADGTGGTRIVNYNWYQHNPEVTGGAVGTYDLGLLHPHGMHVAGTVAGNTQGWARDSQIYSLYYDTGDAGDFSYVFDYIRAFHRNKPTNQSTGRKNPTIVNNSWGMSVFPDEWSFNEITAVTYRGTRYTPSGTPVTTYNGFSGVYNETELLAELVNFENGGNKIITSDSTTASVTSLESNIIGTASLTSSTTPTVGDNDDGYWELNLPFTISFLGLSYNTVYVGTNGFITFGGGSTSYAPLPMLPALPKIMLCGGDRRAHIIYYGSEGLVPDITYRIRVEGASYYADLDTTMIYEYTFYQDDPTRIDLQVDINGAKSTSSGIFTDEQLYDWGFFPGQRIPQRVAGLDADLEDAYAEGIIIVGAAGNGRWKHDVPGGLDWDNTFEMANLNPLSETYPYYYMRGTSPTANDTAESGGYELPAICVGSVDTTTTDQKVSYSDCGPGVDIFAPGTYIISSLPSGSPADPRNSGFYLGKYSGTSMASPQVCGVIASALEIYPEMNQRAAKAYITGIAKSSQLRITNGGTIDGQDLQGAPNLFLYYKKERAETGTVYPKIDCRARPTSGAVYPRVRIRRS